MPRKKKAVRYRSNVFNKGPKSWKDVQYTEDGILKNNLWARTSNKTDRKITEINGPRFDDGMEVWTLSMADYSAIATFKKEQHSSGPYFGDYPLQSWDKKKLLIDYGFEMDDPFAPDINNNNDDNFILDISNAHEANNHNNNHNEQSENKANDDNVENTGLSLLERCRQSINDKRNPRSKQTAYKANQCEGNINNNNNNNNKNIPPHSKFYIGNSINNKTVKIWKEKFEKYRTHHLFYRDSSECLNAIEVFERNNRFKELKYHKCTDLYAVLNDYEVSIGNNQTGNNQFANNQINETLNNNINNNNNNNNNNNIDGNSNFCNNTKDDIIKTKTNDVEMKINKKKSAECVQSELDKNYCYICIKIMPPGHWKYSINVLKCPKHLAADKHECAFWRICNAVIKTFGNVTAKNSHQLECHSKSARRNDVLPLKCTMLRCKNPDHTKKAVGYKNWKKSNCNQCTQEVCGGDIYNGFNKQKGDIIGCKVSECTFMRNPKTEIEIEMIKNNKLSPQEIQQKYGKPRPQQVKKLKCPICNQLFDDAQTVKSHITNCNGVGI